MNIEKKIKEKLKEALQNAIPEFRTHFVLTHEDGSTQECDVEKWFLIGIDRKNKTNVSWGRTIMIGGDEIVADAIHLIAMLMCSAEELGLKLCQAVPGLDKEELSKCVEYAMKKIHEERADNDENHD